MTYTPSSFQDCQTPRRCAMTVVDWLASSTSKPILLALERMAYCRLEWPRITHATLIMNDPWTSFTVGSLKSVSAVRTAKCTPGAESRAEKMLSRPRQSACVLKKGELPSREICALPGACVAHLMTLLPSDPVWVLLLEYVPVGTEPMGRPSGQH